MCGIVGYVGPKQATRILMEALRRMEYRGYDSAGIAVISGKGIEIHKAAGKLGILAGELVGHEPAGTTGMGHTRWATHGGPTTINAHPHLDQSGRIALIHNGIIENATAIKKALLARGHVFLSETDTEVLAHLIGELYEGSLEEAVAAALRDVDGAYGIVVLSADEPGTLVTARNGSTTHSHSTSMCPNSKRAVSMDSAVSCSPDSAPLHAIAFGANSSASRSCLPFILN